MDLDFYKNWVDLVNKMFKNGQLNTMEWAHEMSYVMEEAKKDGFYPVED